MARRLTDFKEYEKTIQDLADKSKVKPRNFNAMVLELIKSGLEQLTKGETK